MSLASFATSVPDLPMLTPISAFFSAERRNAVSSHGYHFVPFLQSFHNSEFVQRINPGKYANILHCLLKLFITHGSKFSRSDYFAFREIQFLAMAYAVTGWSPVIIIGLIPASRHLSTASLTSGRSGSFIATNPKKVRSFSILSLLWQGAFNDFLSKPQYLKP